MSRVVIHNGREWKLDSGVVPSETRGRPPDPRLAALDDELARAVIAGEYRKSREAAKLNVERYEGRSFEDYEHDRKLNRIAEIKRRIDRRMSQLTTK